MNAEKFIIKFYACDSQEQFLKDVNHNLNCLQHENQQLKDRIDKALEHIDECCWYPDCNNYSNMCDYEVKELLKILKGENND